ncbi:C-type lectin lectoxin-Lio2-like [Biomphalaria glabrata]|uniref:C-type lectin lectoxin-Lio2-like n=1 Tax=Biomphalaria glabrata TaxID=6526 RepID=A0A9W2YXL1_BIOGL|nr:C-type lectin lectoxin-Lio2-like [Biomphalaria glabrata]XP_055867452.1 C-type lectin lectoxin-Lio2-like [Biomphalaria glabrata]XP_055867453.1 C-type lectin lectoxin-Lio2-like [Biomphalaria glabrata]XP_055867454.1 C-type lectin lectoxin-Lio2-like [Biomphalaria glabrata]
MDSSIFVIVALQLILQEHALVGQKVTCSMDGSIVSTGRCYKKYTEVMNWETAKEACQLLNGSLATFDSKTQLQDLDIAMPFWIGANDVDKDGVWLWASNNESATSLLKDLWALGQAPSTPHDCAVVMYMNSTVSVGGSTCTNQLHYICMWPAQNASDSSTLASNSILSTP